MPHVTEEHAPKGSMQAEISNAIVQVLSAYPGRGPTRARTTIAGDLVVCMLADTMTRGEHSLAADGRGELVLNLRKAYQQMMRHEIVTAVERVTSRKAIAFMSDNHLDPDYAVEVVVLEPLTNGSESPPEPAG